jgi:hypothetical protein
MERNVKSSFDFKICTSLKKTFRNVVSFFPEVP